MPEQPLIGPGKVDSLFHILRAGGHYSLRIIGTRGARQNYAHVYTAYGAFITSLRCANDGTLSCVSRAIRKLLTSGVVVS